MERGREVAALDLRRDRACREWGCREKHERGGRGEYGRERWLVFAISLKMAFFGCGTVACASPMVFCMRPLHTFARRKKRPSSRGWIPINKAFQGMQCARGRSSGSSSAKVTTSSGAIGGSPPGSVGGGPAAGAGGGCGGAWAAGGERGRALLLSEAGGGGATSGCAEGREGGGVGVEGKRHGRHACEANEQGESTRGGNEREHRHDQDLPTGPGGGEGVRQVGWASHPATV